MAMALEAVPARAAAECRGGDPASRCARLACSGGATRRGLARAAGAFVLVRGWEALGFARLHDYAVERLGVSGRELQDLARVDAALGALPRVERALVAGGISWTKARLLARVATPEDEERWLGVAKAHPARALAREVRRMDVGSLEAGGSGAASAEDDDGTGARATLELRCSPAARAKWHRARLLANRVAGRRLTPWECAEAVAAEVLSALPLEGAEADAVAAGPGVAAVSPEGGGPRLPRAERRARAARIARSPELEGDAFALDARLRELVTREQRAEAELAEALLVVAEGRLHRGQGFRTLDAYAQEELGISPRKARMLLRLTRAGRRVPVLGGAWRRGELSFLRAYALVPVVVAAPAHVAGWIARTRQGTCLRLEDEVAAALVAAEVDPEGFAVDGGLPETEADASTAQRRQTGAQATGSDETVRLMIQGPSDVVRLVRATLCTVRRALERRLGRCPTQGEAFEAMLDHAFAEWLPREGRSARRSERVYERDGWRCTAPACSSYRNLQDHHIVFRSRGGSDALENRTTLCAWHHLRGVHAGRVRCTGTAPGALRFELGLRPGKPPLVVYGEPG
jgi:hypothetical protein